jgi:hypothetical protein
MRFQRAYEEPTGDEAPASGPSGFGPKAWPRKRRRSPPVRLTPQANQSRIEAVKLPERFQSSTRRVVSKQKVPQKMIPWVEAKRRYRLTDEQIQMARELGMNPKKLGKLDNHQQEPWKTPLPEFIEELYQKRFKKHHPNHVVRLD